MKPAYEKVATAFKSESDCVIAQMNADDEQNRPISGKYGVTSFPTIQFFPKGSGKPIPYNLGRNEEQFTEVSLMVWPKVWIGLKADTTVSSSMSTAEPTVPPPACSTTSPEKSSPSTRWLPSSSPLRFRTVLPFSPKPKKHSRHCHSRARRRGLISGRTRRQNTM